MPDRIPIPDEARMPAESGPGAVAEAALRAAGISFVVIEAVTAPLCTWCATNEVALAA